MPPFAALHAAFKWFIYFIPFFNLLDSVITTDHFLYAITCTLLRSITSNLNAGTAAVSVGVPQVSIPQGGTRAKAGQCDSGPAVHSRSRPSRVETTTSAGCRSLAPLCVTMVTHV